MSAGFDLAEDPGQPLGLVPVTGRGALPFASLGDHPLVVLASAALEEAGVRLLDFNVDLARVRAAGRPLVLHDPLCPLTPSGFLREAVETAVTEDVVVVGVQPVTDTVKRVAAGVVGETVDRDTLWAVTSPVVLPAPLVSRLEDWPDADDLAGLVTRLRRTEQVCFLQAPDLGRRVDDESSVALLEALAAAAGATAAAAARPPRRPGGT